MISFRKSDQYTFPIDQNCYSDQKGRWKGARYVGLSHEKQSKKDTEQMIHQKKVFFNNPPRVPKKYLTVSLCIQTNQKKTENWKHYFIK